MNKAFVLLSLFALLALICAQDTSVSSSHSSESVSSSSGDIDHDDNQVNRREFDISINGGKVEIEGRSRNSNFRDRFEVEIETNSDSGRLLEIEVRYRVDTNSDDARDEFRFRFRLEAILEWVDANQNGKYDTGEEIFSYTGPKTWSAWTQASSTQKKRAGTTVYDFTAQTTDGVLGVAAHLATGPTTLYDANGCKFDLDVNFPFTRGNSTGIAFLTRLITESRVDDSEGELESESESHAESVSSSSSSSGTTAKRGEDGEGHVSIHQDSVFDKAHVLGRFLWAGSLEAGSSNVVVHAGAPSNGGGDYEIVFWVDEHHDSYFWDPELRVDFTGSGSMLTSWISYLF